MEKHKALRSRILRESARGQDCLLQTGVCNGNPETTVLCHIPHHESKGMGLKPDDFLAVWGCSDCHSLLDNRNDYGLSKETRLEIFHKAYLKQIAKWIELGYLEIKNG
jgi:hypothetical protein